MKSICILNVSFYRKYSGGAEQVAVHKPFSDEKFNPGAQATST